MNAILLAAGYGMRLYPLTRDRPKPLLRVGGRPILDHLLDRLEAAPEVERLVLVSNDRFADDFARWAERRRPEKPLTLLNDGSTCNEDRRGAVADIRFAVEEAGLRGAPAYVLATDNLPRFDLRAIIGLCREKGASAVFACRVAERRRLRRMGVARLDEEGRIVAFEEKPSEPQGNLRVPPFYLYTPEAVDAVGDFLRQGREADAPGHLLAWLVGRLPVYALRRDEGTHDIGTLESYRAVCAEFDAAAHGPAK